MADGLEEDPLYPGARFHPSISPEHRAEMVEQGKAMKQGEEDAKKGIYEPVFVTDTQTLTVDYYVCGHTNQITKTWWRRWLYRLGYNMQFYATGVKKIGGRS